MDPLPPQGSTGAISSAQVPSGDSGPTSETPTAKHAKALETSAVKDVSGKSRIGAAEKDEEKRPDGAEVADSVSETPESRQVSSASDCERETKILYGHIW